MALEIKEPGMVPGMKTITFSQEDVERALELIFSECFGAMKMANLLGGSKDNPWKLIHSFSLDEIFAEAKRMGIDLRSIKPAILGDDKTIDDLKWVKKYL